MLSHLFLVVAVDCPGSVPKNRGWLRREREKNWRSREGRRAINVGKRGFEDRDVGNGEGF